MCKGYSIYLLCSVLKKIQIYVLFLLTKYITITYEYFIFTTCSQQVLSIDLEHQIFLHFYCETDLSSRGNNVSQTVKCLRGGTYPPPSFQVKQNCLYSSLIHRLPKSMLALFLHSPACFVNYGATYATWIKCLSFIMLLCPCLCHAGILETDITFLLIFILILLLSCYFGCEYTGWVYCVCYFLDVG